MAAAGGGGDAADSEGSAEAAAAAAAAVAKQPEAKAVTKQLELELGAALGELTVEARQKVVYAVGIRPTVRVDTFSNMDDSVPHFPCSNRVTRD